MPSINDFEILATSPEYFWFLAVLAVLAVSISKAGFGGALGSFSVPILLFALPPKLAIGVLLPLFLVTDVWVVYIWRKMLDKRILLIMCYSSLQFLAVLFSAHLVSPFLIENTP